MKECRLMQNFWTSFVTTRETWKNSSVSKQTMPSVLLFLVLSFLFSCSLFHPFLFPFNFYFSVLFLVHFPSSVFLDVFLSPSFTFSCIISWPTFLPSPLFLFILADLPSHLLTFAYRCNQANLHATPLSTLKMTLHDCVLNCSCLLTLPAAWLVASIVHLSDRFLAYHSLSLSMKYEKQTDDVISPLRWRHITHASHPERTVYFWPCV